MQVVHISKVTGIAGSEGHLLRLLPGLQARGVMVKMLILEDPRYPVNEYVAVLEAVDVPVEIFRINGHLDLSLPGRLTRQLASWQSDIVHTHLIHADFYGLPAARRAGVRFLISSRHNNDAFRHNPLIKWVNLCLMQQADCVITISQALERFVVEVEGIDKKKVVAVHYGLEVPSPTSDAGQQARLRIGIDDDQQVVGVFGRLVWQKGIDVLIEAFQAVRAEHPSAQLVIVGDGPLRAELEGQVEQTSLTDAITFTGWVDNGRELMPGCDVIVVPSRWEGFGLVTLEAMGYRRPLVVSKTSALPEIVVDGETGLHVPPENVEALAKAISVLLAEPDTAARYGKAGYERLVNEFSIDKMVTGTLDVYHKLMDR